MLNRIKELFRPRSPFAEEQNDSDAAVYLPREKILVFGISFILAFCLWFIVNLSRDFNITLDLPLVIGNLPEDMALVSDPPDNATVGVTGEGWKLIALYSNPPSILLDVVEDEVSLFDKVQQQVSVISEVTVTRVQPHALNLNFEEKEKKVVPVETSVEIETRERFNIVGDPEIEPDSVTVSGAASKIADIERVKTRPVSLQGVQSAQEVRLELERPGQGITLDPGYVIYRFDVTEFTEGEVRVPIRIRNLPPGRAVTYNPSYVTVRYFVPIDQYSEVQNIRPFNAYVDFTTIEEDTTGLVSPQVERVEDGFNVQLRSFQPRTVSYFKVVENE